MRSMETRRPPPRPAKIETGTARHLPRAKATGNMQTGVRGKERRGCGQEHATQDVTQDTRELERKQGGERREAWRDAARSLGPSRPQ